MTSQTAIAARLCIYAATSADDAWLKRCISQVPRTTAITLAGTFAKRKFAGRSLDFLPSAAATEDSAAVLCACAKAHPGEHIVLLHAGALLPEFWFERITRALALPDVLAVSALDNIDPSRAPLPAGAHSNAIAQDIDALCFAYSRHQYYDCKMLSPLLSAWHAQHLTEEFLASLKAFDVTATLLPSRTVLLDHLYVAAPDRDLFGPTVSKPDNDSTPASPLGELRELLAAALQLPKRKGTSSGYIGLDGKPVVLHILHGWGGGAERFVRDLASVDIERHHLVLIARGNSLRKRYGESLELLRGDFSQPSLRRITLPVAIADTALHDVAYTEFLATILREFCVDGLIISSLIGHSLDVLRSALPMLIVGHDYYPLWPILHRDFGDTQLAFDDAQLDRELSDRKRPFEFANRNPRYWRTLRENYVDTILHAAPTLVAPSRSALSNLLRIEPRFKVLHNAVVGHGLAPWATDYATFSPSQSRPRLRLVVPGRVRHGKGGELLRTALSAIRGNAEIFLLGAGHEGEMFFGDNDVHIVMNYARDELPALIARISPDAALLLPTVAETFSYTLSEMWSLGVPVIATNLGSLAERIVDGVNGWLVAPNAAAIGSLLYQLNRDRAGLAQMHLTLVHQPQTSLESMSAQYSVLLPLTRPTAPRDSIRDTNAESLLISELSERLGETLRDLAALKKRLGNQLSELEKRGDWAIGLERELRRATNVLKQREIELNERTAWATTLQQDVASTRTVLSELRAEFEERTRWADELQDEIDSTRTTLASLRDEFDERTRWAVALEHEINASRHAFASLRDEFDERTHWVIALENEIDDSRNAFASLRNEFDERTRWVDNLQHELDSARTAMVSLREEFDERTRWALAEAEEIMRLGEQLRELDALRIQAEQERDKFEQQRDHMQAWRDAVQTQRDEFEAERNRILASRSWRLTGPFRWLTRRLRSLHVRIVFQLTRLRSVHGRVRGSLTRRGFRGTLTRAAQELRQTPPSTQTTQVSAPTQEFYRHAIPTSSTPLVSIIIPVYNKFAYTDACLHSLATHAGKITFEVIVVDDGSSDETSESLRLIDGIRAVRNKENLGFVGSCNAGARLARGEFVLFLNNDTVVTPGWLEALVAVFAEDPRAGLVGAKLVYPDGRLQEAGGIIFSDGSGWNYGRFDDPAKPQFNYRREVDYCSGAAIMLRRALFEQLGGFDQRYAPAYYEDTDMAFAVRAAGLKVIYEPSATVIHFEGITSGTDIASGIKRYQVVNQQKFLDKWADALSRQPVPNTRIELAREHRVTGRALIVDACTPAPDQDSGSLRMVNLMRVLIDLGYKVSFFADNRAYDEKYTPPLQQLGVEVMYYPYLNDTVAFFREYGKLFDAIVLSRHYIATNYVELVRLYAPQARLIFDTVDLHYLREERAAALIESNDIAREAARTKTQELRLMRDCDVTLVVSPVEREILSHEVPGGRIEVLSNVHEVFGCRRAYAERHDLVFVGGFQHPPNIDAVQFFVREIFPLVRQQLPQVLFHVVGSKAPPEILTLKSEGVVVHGFVPDITSFMDDCRLSIAPLRYGAGVKGKVNMAMSYGLPVVATLIAIEGMHVREGEDVLVSDDPVELAALVVQAYGSEALWNRLSQNGMVNVSQYFSFDAARRAVAHILS